MRFLLLLCALFCFLYASCNDCSSAYGHCKWLECTCYYNYGDCLKTVQYNATVTCFQEVFSNNKNYQSGCRTRQCDWCDPVTTPKSNANILSPLMFLNLIVNFGFLLR